MWCEMAEIHLKLDRICKSFPGVRALNNVHFELCRGEIHALMGENGAGKSTFIKVITGVYHQDEGEILLNGEKLTIRNPKEAYKHSIAAIYQHSTSYPHLSITENIFIGHEDVAGPLRTIRWAPLHKRAAELLRELGSDLDPHTPVGNLTVAEQQVVEIAKAISANASILIMDEPTASLSQRECDNLYAIAEKLRDSGVSIIFISHRFEDMFRLADRVTVLRDGQYIGTWNVKDITQDELITAMVGRQIDNIYPEKDCPIGDEIFRVENLRRTGYYSKVSFGLKAGEILGFTGLVGAGRTEVMQSIFGTDPLDGGEIYMEGKQLKIRKPLDAMRAGIGLLPEDRLKQSLILDWEIYRNITLANLAPYTHATIVNTKQEREKAAEIGARIAVKAPTVYEKVSKLSGGNQQKVVICKLLNSDLKVLILDEPTKGVDVGAKNQIYEIMIELAGQGYGIIMISSDMPEIIGMSDRIIAMHEGTVSGEFLRGQATQEQILTAVMGLDAQKGSVANE